MKKTAAAVAVRRGPKPYPVRSPEEIGTGLATVKEAAKHLCVSPERIYELANRGAVPSYKIGASRRFKLAELDAWVMEQQVAA